MCPVGINNKQSYAAANPKNKYNWQTEHDLKLAPRSEYPPDGSHQEQFQGFISVFVRIGSQKVMQGVTDALCAVPLQAVQVIPDWMVAVFIGNNLDGALHLFLAGKPVIFFQIQKQVVHVPVGCLLYTSRCV